MPEAKELIYQALTQDPAVLNCTLEDQWEALVVKPLLQAFSNADYTQRSLIVIDGLDECEPQASQQRLLRLLLTVYERGLHQRIAILIASRPEAHIASEIDSLIFDFPSRFRLPHLMLTETEESRADMRLILTTSFNDIRRHRALIIGNRHWPPDGTIERIIDLANGQFIYTLTIVRWLKEEDGNPVKRLEAIFESCNDQKARAFASLDRLYNLILMVACSKESGDLVLPCLYMLTYQPHTHLGTYGRSNRLNQFRSLSAFFKKDLGDMRITLQPLHFVLVVPDDDNGIIGVYHKSFSEYLNDKNRSWSYCIQDSKVLGQLLIQALTPDVTRFDVPDRYRGVHQWLLLPFTSIVMTPDLLDALLQINCVNWLRENCLVLWPNWIEDQDRYKEFHRWLVRCIPKEREDVLRGFPPDLFDVDPYMSLDSWTRDLQSGSLSPRSTSLLFLRFWLHSIDHDSSWYLFADLLRFAIQSIGLVPAERHTCIAHKAIFEHDLEWQEWFLMLVSEQCSQEITSPTIPSLISSYDDERASVIHPILPSAHVLYAFWWGVNTLRDPRSYFFWNCLNKMQRLDESVLLTRRSLTVLTAIVQWVLVGFMEDRGFQNAAAFIWGSFGNWSRGYEYEPEFSKRRALSLWYIERFDELAAGPLRDLVASLKGHKRKEWPSDDDSARMIVVLENELISIPEQECRCDEIMGAVQIDVEVNRKVV